MKKRSKNNNRYCPPSYIDAEGPLGFRPGDWRRENSNCDGFVPLSRAGSNNYSKDTKAVRATFKKYFCSSEGEVEWQMGIVNRVS